MAEYTRRKGAIGKHEGSTGLPCLLFPNYTPLSRLHRYVRYLVRCGTSSEVVILASTSLDPALNFRTKTIRTYELNYVAFLFDYPVLHRGIRNFLLE